MVMLALAAAWVALPQSARAQDADAPTAVDLDVQLSGEANSMISSAIARLEGADVDLSLQTILTDTADARASFVAGDTDMIVSGVGFGPQELSDLQKSGRGVISAPVQATALAAFGYIPAPIAGDRFPTADAWLRAWPLRCEELNEDGESPCALADISPFTGPFRLTPSAVGQMIFSGRSVFASTEFKANQDPGALAGRTLIAPNDIPRAIVRSGADASNYYLERYVEATQPQDWRAWMAQTPGQTADTKPSEVWPVDSQTSRRSMDDVLSLIREGLSGSDSILNFSGAFAFVPPGKVAESVFLNAARPKAEQIPLYTAQLRNGAGEWVSATPAAITAAVAAGDGAPLTGATTPVPGAYPLTWVNRLYAPASGLTAAQANAVATIIRTQVTTGRAQAAQIGDGQITDKMVVEALTAANQIVESNCGSAGGEVVTSKDGAPYAPAGAITGVSSMKLCDPPAGDGDGSGELAPDGGYSDLGYGDPGSYDDGTVDDSGFTPLETITESGGVDGSGGASGGGGAVGDEAAEAAAISRRMPMELPTLSLSPLDRVVTLGLGALTFIILRNLATKRAWAS
ncbi:hypothetical protein [Dermatobacter hominis]|uniref:hypothetical protein n=1 Tax=Dermatobacter hominis TaxID=2884263 RepID=UPI001D0FCBDF|nr:hypothetical protein [Dermatobacter hominis]UDY37921.1 hypothetical protein LH044_10335 [Dermatobacter hominis]